MKSISSALLTLSMVSLASAGVGAQEHVHATSGISDTVTLGVTLGVAVGRRAGPGVCARAGVTRTVAISSAPG